MANGTSTTPSGVPGRVPLAAGKPWYLLWGAGCLIAGIISLVFNQSFDWVSGVFLVVLGAATLWLREATAYIVCGAGVLWVSVPNFLGGNTTFLLLGILEALLGALGLAHGARRLAAERASAPASSRPYAPWSVILGVVGLLGLIATWAYTTFGRGGDWSRGISELGYRLAWASTDAGVLGASLGLRALLAREPRRGLAWMGLVAGTIPALAFVTVWLLFWR